MPPLYRFLLSDPATGDYYRVDAGVVSLGSVEYPLEFSPIGWDDMRLGYRRMEEHGMFRSLTTSLQFVKEGADILRYILRTQGTGSKAILTIQQRGVQFGEGWIYTTLESGLLDFGRLRNIQNGVSIAMKEGGKVAKYRERKDTPFEVQIFLDDEDVLDVEMDGFKILNTAAFIVSDNLTGTDNTNKNHVPALTLYQQEVEIISDVQSVNYTDTGALIFPGLQMLKASASTTVVIEYDYSLQANLLSGINYAATTVRSGFFVKDMTGTTTQTNDVLVEADSVVYGNTVYHLTGSVSFTINPGDTMYMRTGTSGAPADITWQYTFSTPVAPNTIKLSYDAIYQTTICRHLPYWKYFNLLADKVFDGTGTSDSDFFQEFTDDIDSRPYYLGVTCGTELRGLSYTLPPGGEPVIGNILPLLVASIGDLYKDISARFAVGMGVENGLLRIERLSHYYQGDVEIYDAGVVSDFSEEPALDMMGNVYKNGYAPQNYDKLNGRYESNLSWTWKLPDGMKTGAIEDVCAFRSDPYGVEYMRALRGKPTTDAEGDNTIFVNQLGHDDGPATLPDKLARNQVSASGVYDPVGIYNLELSPKRNLLRRAAVLHAACWGQDDQSITFQTTDKNRQLTSEIFNGTIDEDSDVLVGDLGRLLYLPVIQKFTTIAPINLPALIDANPFGYIRFIANGMERKGFLLQVEMKPGIQSAFEWTLIAHPDSYVG